MFSSTSIYRELRSNRGGPLWSNSSYGNHGNSVRTNTILDRLRARRERISAARYSVNNRTRTEPRPSSKDRRRNMARITDKEEKEKIEEEERRLREAEEAARLDAERLAKLKEEVLTICDYDLHVQQNSQDHHTDLFECTDRLLHPQLVVRRGQEFKITLTFQRPFSSKDDDLHLMFWLGEETNPSKGTITQLKLEEGKDINYMIKEDKEWGARINKLDGNDLQVAVYVPPDVVIGEWEFSFLTIKHEKDGKEETFECETSQEIVILLNPWCEDDEVYMEKTEDLEEYILNDVGLAFVGSHRKLDSRPWDFGQFKENILKHCVEILRMAFKSAVSPKMASAVEIARGLSRILNSIDNEGVLVGRWDGSYDDGESPSSWQGSSRIIEKFFKEDQPVKYGQCWVFSHLMTTVCRALGLPCRSVTNFSSAHDTDLTMTIDKYVDEEGEELGWMNDDSVWNFHVWNEVWILRPDLDEKTGHPHKYDGWHAVDSTPQEASDSLFQCGPAPLSAIKEGDVHIGYDTKFIFAEVNSDICTWRQGMPPVLLSAKPASVGRFISTKWPNGGNVGNYIGYDRGVRLDLTDQYKYREGTAAERAVVSKATKKGKFGHLLHENTSGVEVTIGLPEGKLRVGEDIPVKFQVKNTVSDDRKVRLRISVRPTNYWGAMLGKAKVVAKLYEWETLKPGRSENYEVTADADDIVRLCDESLSMKVMAMCQVSGNDAQVFESEQLVLKTPGIKCTGPERKVGREEVFEVELTLKNPQTNKAMTGCKLQIEGTILVEDDSFKNLYGAFVSDVEDLKPREVRLVKVKVRATPSPRRSTKRELNVELLSNELPGFIGNLHIDLE